MTNIVKFDFEGKGVRTHVSDDGQTWFCARDVCDALAISDERQAIDMLDEDERGGYNVPTPGGPQKVRFISESGLYALVFRSRKAQAKAFSRWVRHEVLPTLRKTGSYSVKDHGQLTVPTDLNGLMAVVKAYVDERVTPLEVDLEAERKRAEHEAARAERLVKEKTSAINEMRIAQRSADIARRRLDSVAKHAYRAIREAEEEMASVQGDLMSGAEASNVLTLPGPKKT